MTKHRTTFNKQSPVFEAESKKVDRHQFQTPSPVCKYMASLIHPGAVTVLEPTPGDGNIVRELGAFQVTAPDDFFLLPAGRFDCVVMNPPFSSRYANMENAPPEMHKAGMRMGYEILKLCIQRSDHVIALMPWFTISDSDVRLRSLKHFGIKSITALPRATFKYARIQTVVLDLVKGWRDPSVFKVMDTFKTEHQPRLIENT